MDRLTQSVVPSLADAAGTGPLTWLWVLIGAVVVLGVVALLLTRRYSGRYVGRGTVVIGGWLSEAIKASDRGAALHAAVVAAGQPQARAAADSGARWSDIRRRAQDLEQELVSLRRVAPEADDRARVTDALTSLQSLRYVLEDERAGDAGQAPVIQARLAAFEESLRRLRSPEHHLW